LFLKELYNITLANDIAGQLFDNITAANYRADKTFTATLRAVLHKRLPADESLHVALVPTTPENIMSSIKQHDYDHSYSIYIVYGEQVPAAVRNLDGYTQREDLRIFYIRMLDGLFYTNYRSAVIFLDSLDFRKFHALQMMIPKYLPALFADAPLTAEETALLKSLGGRGHAEYERLIEEFAQRLDMRSEMIRTRLKGFETVYERNRHQAVNQNLEKARVEYTMHMNNLRRVANDIQDLQVTLAGLESVIDNRGDGESEIMEYFLCNKNLSLVRVNGSELEFVVHGYVDIYDEDALETYLDNPNSYLYNQTDDVSKETMERFYRAIFLDRRFRIRICAAYKANMRSSITPQTGYTFPPESWSYIPNPHIQRHGCIGGYAQRFMEYMHNRDYVGAIDQAAVSARNLNFHDSGVISGFIRKLLSTALRCIEDRDGNLMTPRALIKKLEEET